MEANKSEYYSLGEIITLLKSFVHFLGSKWLSLLLALITGAGLGTGYYFLQKPKYEAVCTFILEEKSAGGGGLAGLASQFGFDLGSMGGGGNIFAGDNILNILISKKIVQQVLLTPVHDSAVGSLSLADLYLEFNGNKKRWRKVPALADINFRWIQSTLTPVQDSVLTVIYQSLVEKNLKAERASKQGSIIKVQVTAPDNRFARLLTERLVEKAAELYSNIKTGTAEANIRQLQRRSDSLLTLLNRKSFSAAASQPLDINPALRTAIVPTEIANRDKAVIATLYAEVTKNLEASKVLLSQQTPVVQLLDRPSILLEDNKKGLPFLLVIASMVTGIAYLAVAFLIFLFKSRISLNTPKL